MDDDNKSRKSDDNSIEEDIEEVITFGSSGDDNSINKNVPIESSLLAKKRALFDIEAEDPFGINDDELSGGMLAKHFQPLSNKDDDDIVGVGSGNDGKPHYDGIRTFIAESISSKSKRHDSKKSMSHNIEDEEEVTDHPSKSLTNQSTTNDISEIDNEHSNVENLCTRSLELRPNLINYEDRKSRSLDTAIDFSTLIEEQDHSMSEAIERNHSIAISFNDKDLSELGSNVDINNESQINRILQDTQDVTKLSLPSEDHNTVGTDSNEDDMNVLKQKILSMNEAPSASGPKLNKEISFEQTEDQSIQIKQMERVHADFSKEVLEDITEESEKVSTHRDNENTSDDFDSIISLNMIQMLENKVKDLKEVVAGKDVCLASLNMQLDAIQKRETFQTIYSQESQESPDTTQRRESSVVNEGRDSLKELPPSGRESCSLVTTSTEYRTIQEDYGNRMFDFHTEITQRDHLIEKLTDSLQQSMHIREQLQQQSDKLSNEVQLLRKQLTDTLDVIKKPFWPRDQESTGQRLSEISIDLVSESDEDLDRHFLTDNEEKMSSNRNSKERQLDPVAGFETYEVVSVSKQIEQFQKYLNPDELRIFFMVQKKFDDFLSEEIEKSKMKFEAEVKVLGDQLENEKHERESEINRLRQILTNVKDGSTELTALRKELEAIHSREMESLRTYFEKKCADLEKHYSEEVFSQKSQRNSVDSNSEISDEENFPEESPIRSKESSPRKRTREELYASPTHRQMTPTTLSQTRDENSISCGERKSHDKEPNISAEELKSFYQEKIHEIKRQHEQTVRKLHERLKRFEAKYADDEFMALLSETTTDDNHWPPELILLREKFTAKSQLEIAQLQIKHEEEMSRLKCDYEKQLIRKNKRNSTFDLSRDLDQIVSERDNLRELSNTFRWLLCELAKCISICEDDLNNTLLEELQKHGLYQQTSDHVVGDNGDHKDNSHEESSGFLNISTQSQLLQSTFSKKLRFVPDVAGLLTLVEDPSLVDFITQNNTDSNSFNLKDCLDKLKSEANYLLELSENLYKKGKDDNIMEKGDSCEEEDGLKSSVNRTPQKVIRASSLNENLLLDKQPSQSNQISLSLPNDISRLQFCSESIIEDVQISTGPASELNFQVHELKNRLVKSENDRQKLQHELETTIRRNQELGVELNALREQLEQLDSQKEDFSEGYGLSNLKSPPRLRSVKPTTSFSQLQEKARNFLSTPTKSMSEKSGLLLQLIEDFCREGEKVVETGKKERDDLQSQIDAADKQLKATRNFLEDQAAERELERDDFIKEIEKLKILVRDKEKERSSFENASKEAEQMELHIKDLSHKVNEFETRKDKLEIELKASIDKIFVLREIISGLETQVETKELNEHVLNEKIKELESYISSQNRSNETLQQEVTSLKLEIDHGYQEKIANLEEQLRNSRTSAEQSVLLGQIAEQLRDIETTLDQKTKTLESLHQAVCSNSCSTSPSEDVSVQVQDKTKSGKTKPTTSNQVEGTSEVLSPQETTPRQHSLPIDEIQRVFEKLDKHTRVEEAAIKRIRDLEMQVQNIRTTYGELQHERDNLQERMAEQLLRISTLQSKLDEQRHRAEELQRQGTSDLTIRIHDLQNELLNLKETLSARDKQITNLKNHLEQSKAIIDRQEAELAIGIQGDRSALEKLESELKSKTEENKKLKEKMKNEMINKLALPDLMETMLADKNEEIDHLKEQLESKQKELQGILEINLSQVENSPKDKSKDQADAKLSARTLSDIVSISEYDEPDVIRRAVLEQETPFTLPQGHQFHEQAMESSKFAIGNLTEKRTGDLTPLTTGPPIGTSTFDNPNYFQEGTMAKDGNTITPIIIPRQINFSEFADDSKMKESTPKIEEIFQSDDVKCLKKQLKSAEQNSDSLKISLENLEKEKNTEIDRLKIDLASKIKLYDELVIEKRSLDDQLEDARKELLKYSMMQNELQQKQLELSKFELEANKKQSQVDLLEEELKTKIEEIEDLKMKIEKFATDNASLTKKITNAMNSTQKVDNLLQQIEVMKKILKEKDEILSKHEKNLINYQQNEQNNLKKIAELEVKCQQMEDNQEIDDLKEELNSLRVQLSEKALLYEKSVLDIQSYEKQIETLKENLKEKNDLINSMSTDSKGLQDVIVAIQNKLEDGQSLTELKRKLKQEIDRNLKLEERNSILDNELEKLRSQNSDNARPFSLDEIAEQVEKELNYSAQLDSNILKAIESEEENNLDTQFKTENNKIIEKDIINELQTIKAQLEKEKYNSNKFEKLWNEEKQQSQDIQQQDANIIEAMRVRLEAALEQEQELHKMLDEEREKCERLTTQISVLQRSESRKASLLLRSPPDSPRRTPRTSDFESELADRLKSEIKLLTSQNDRERERIVDLQRSLEREKNRFETELSDRIEYGERLKREMEKLGREKDLAEQEVEHLQERVTLASREIESLECRISTLQEAETRRAHRRGRERIETTQNVIEMQELKTTIKNLESERDHLNHTVSMLRGDIERGAQREAKLAEALTNSGGTDSSTIPDQFMQKLKEMNYLLTENTKENRQMAETVHYLTQERKTLQKKCEELEDARGGSVITAAHFTELEEKANHLFGKYLKVESHRKALVHQKRYLLIVLQTYQNNEKRALELVGGSSGGGEMIRRPRKKLFKSAALVVIAIQRMKFIVRRWQNNKNIVSKSILNLAQTKRPPTTVTTTAASSLSRSPDQILSSISPPCRDRGTSQQQHVNRMNYLRENALRPLQAPSLISECSDKNDWNNRWKKL